MSINPPKRKRSFTFAALAAAVAALVVATYWPAMHGGFIWVDRIALHDVGWLRGGGDWIDVILHNFYDWTSYFRPLVVALFIGEVRAFDLQPLPMHLVSLGLHLANTCLVGLLASRMLPTPAKAAGHPRTAALAMLLYGLHPALIEPVVWISCQFELVVTFFCLLGLLANRVIETAWLRALAVGGCFLLAAGAKESAIAFPLLLVAFDWIGSAHARKRHAIAALLQRQWLVYAAVAFAGLMYLALRLWALGSLTPDYNAATASIAERLQLASWLLLTYWRILLWPMVGQGPLHEIDLRQFAAFSPHLLAADAAAVAGLAAAAFLFARRNALGGLCVAATIALLPVLHLVPVAFDSSLYHERYAMTAVAVAIALLPRVLAEVAALLGSRLRPWTIIASVLLVGWLGASVLNVRVTLPLWSDEVRLWSWAVRQNPDSVLARNYLLAAYADHGQAASARELAASLLSDRRACPVCLVNVATVALQQGEVETARAALARAQPMLARVHGKRLTELFDLAQGQVSQLDGKFDDAEARFRQAIEIEPQDPRAHMNLALLLAAQRRAAEADAEARQALALFAPDERDREASAYAQAAAANAREKTP